jgi:hypothetical protein
MILKVLHIDTNIISRNNEDSNNILQSRIIMEESFKNKSFYLFSSYVESSSESYGVRDSDGSITSLSESLDKDDKQLLKCRFTIIDVKRKSVYYDGKLEDIKEILQKLFDIKYNEIHINVDIDEFVRLKKLKVKTTKVGQMSASDLNNRYDNKNDLIEDIGIDKGEIESTSYEVLFKKEGGLFNKDKFKEILDDCKSGLRTITVDGFDEDGHEIKLSSHILKKVTILASESSWKQKLELSLEQVLNALLEEIK